MSLVGVVTNVTSAITGAVVSIVVVVSSLLLFLAHEMMVKLKRRERIMSICLTWFPIGGLGKPKLYQNLGDFTIIGDFTCTEFGYCDFCVSWSE